MSFGLPFRVGMVGKPLPKIHKDAIMSGAISFSVDIILQKMTRKSIDFNRTSRLVSFSVLSTYPQVKYFNALDSIFLNQTLHSAIKKTIVNQILFAPVNISCAIAWNLYFESKPEIIIPKLKTSIMPSLTEGSLYWIPMNIIAFTMIPAYHRIIFFKMCGIPYKFIFASRVFNK